MRHSFGFKRGVSSASREGGGTCTCTSNGALALRARDGCCLDVEAVAAHGRPGKAHDHADRRCLRVYLVAREGRLAHVGVQLLLGNHYWLAKVSCRCLHMCGPMSAHAGSICRTSAAQVHYLKFVWFLDNHE